MPKRCTEMFAASFSKGACFDRLINVLYSEYIACNFAIVRERIEDAEQVKQKAFNSLQHSLASSTPLNIFEVTPYRTMSRESDMKQQMASENTLAISHVWIHGMGGRPEEGFNNCLRHLFSTLASQLGCDSYSCDTACIPTQRDLRWDAIQKIEDVFAQCAAALVCDRDLMEIRVSGCSFSVENPDKTVLVSERIPVTVLVCDWNTRA